MNSDLVRCMHENAALEVKETYCKKRKWPLKEVKETNYRSKGQGDLL
jgi:hypothetical protein